MPTVKLNNGITITYETIKYTKEEKELLDKQKKQEGK